MCTRNSFAITLLFCLFAISQATPAQARDVPATTSIGANIAAYATLGATGGGLSALAGRTGNGVGYAGYLATESTNTWSARARNLRADIGSFSQRDPAGLRTQYDSSNSLTGRAALRSSFRPGGRSVMGSHQYIGEVTNNILYASAFYNLYQYVENQPTKLIDPSGMIPVPLAACGIAFTLGFGTSLGFCVMNGGSWTNCAKSSACVGLGACVEAGLGSLTIFGRIGRGTLFGGCLTGLVGNFATRICELGFAAFNRSFNPLPGGSPICRMAEEFVALGIGCIGSNVSDSNVFAAMVGLIPPIFGEQCNSVLGCN